MNEHLDNIDSESRPSNTFASALEYLFTQAEQDLGCDVGFYAAKDLYKAACDPHPAAIEKLHAVADHTPSGAFRDAINAIDKRGEEAKYSLIAGMSEILLEGIHESTADLMADVVYFAHGVEEWGVEAAARDLQRRLELAPEKRYGELKRLVDDYCNDIDVHFLDKNNTSGTLEEAQPGTEASADHLSLGNTRAILEYMLGSGHSSFRGYNGTYAAKKLYDYADGESEKERYTNVINAIHTCTDPAVAAQINESLGEGNAYAQDNIKQELSNIINAFYPSKMSLISRTIDFARLIKAWELHDSVQYAARVVNSLADSGECSDNVPELTRSINNFIDAKGEAEEGARREAELAVFIEAFKDTDLSL